MSDPREVTSLAVHKGSELAGRLSRTHGGAALELDSAYVARGGRPLASTIPLSTAPLEVRGVNLPPFFAGLLPEGLRLRALQRRAKTSEDDLFTLLASLGDDVVGDVWCSPDEGAEFSTEALADPAKAAGLRFAELFERAVDGDDRTSFAGVQPKVSAGRRTLPADSLGRGATHLLKLPSEEFPHLVRNEAFFMGLARAAGLETARVKTITDRDGAPGLLVERFDRTRGSDHALERHAVEDLCQLLDLYPADKYRISLGHAAKALDVATAPQVERLRLLELQAYSFLIGNGDLHGKNASVVTRNGTTRLSPAYDLVSTLPYGDDHMAMKLDGKDARLKRRDFVTFAARFGLREQAVEGMLDRLVARFLKGLRASPGVASIGFDEGTATRLEDELMRRADQLG